jgi:hypothetical protein
MPIKPYDEETETALRGAFRLKNEHRLREIACRSAGVTYGVLALFLLISAGYINILFEASGLPLSWLASTPGTVCLFLSNRRFARSGWHKRASFDYDEWHYLHIDETIDRSAIYWLHATSVDDHRNGP